MDKEIGKKTRRFGQTTIIRINIILSTIPDFQSQLYNVVTRTCIRPQMCHSQLKCLTVTRISFQQGLTHVRVTPFLFFCFFVTRQDADPRIKVEYVWYCYAVRKCHHTHDSEKLVTYACAAQKTNDI